MAEPSAQELRAQIAAQLKQHERDLATQADAPVPQPAPYEPPLSGGQTERGAPGEPLKAPANFAPTEGYTTVGGGATGGYVVPKNAMRDTLNLASGGGTEAVNAAVQGAGAQAAGEVTPGGLTVQQMSPEERARLEGQANPEGGGMLVRTPAGWRPGTRTNAQGETGKDPNAVASALELQQAAGNHDLKALEQTQEADRSQYGMLQKVQQNEFKATQSFKKQADGMQEQYDAERSAQMAKLSSIQKAMDAVPNAPRTIREKLDRSGTSDKIRFGLAAGFSILGGGMMRDGGATAQNFLKTVQGNIDRGVQQEADEYSRLGDRAKMSDNIYAHLRTGLQDDQAAMNITKALYYDAAMNTVEQIATQYKMDTQAPQVQSLIAHLQRERQKLIVDTASTLQDQTSQTDKYNPGGVALIGGGAKKDMYDSEPLTKGLKEYHDAFEKAGGNAATRAIALYQKAQQEMREGGFQNDEKFLSVFAAMNSADSPAQQAAILTDANLNPKQRAALQHVIEAGSEQLKDESGKAVTANELARDIMKKGGYSITSLDSVRDTLAKKRENVYAHVDAGFGGKHNIIGDTYRSRQALSESDRKNPGIGTDAPQAVDPNDLRRQVKGQLQQ